MTTARLAPEAAQRRRRIVNEYLMLLAAEHGRRTARETASHLNSFFTEVDKEPDDVTTADVLRFLRRQRLAMTDDARLARLIERRLRSVIGLFIYVQSGTITEPPAGRGRTRCTRA